jgi:hypothetical protein
LQRSGLASPPAPCGRPLELTAALVAAHLVKPTGALGDPTYLVVIWAAPVVAWLGTLATPTTERLVPALISIGLSA